MKNLNLRAWLSLVTLAAVIAALLFIAAGTLDYWEGWLYLALFFGAAVLTTEYVIRRDPALLERRMRGGPTAEQRPAQKIIQAFTSLGFLALVIVPGLDRRYEWSDVPAYAVFTGDALVAIGFYLAFLVYKETTFASATIQVVEDQRVISTGPYALVRHPMYTGGGLLLLGMPLALGSYWAFIPFAGILLCLMWRIFDEERLLGESLPGYTEYRKRVPYRLVPRIW